VGLYRRSAIDKVGGLFDPTWFMYKEDVDLAIRLYRAGYRAWFEKHAIAWHMRGVKERRKGFITSIIDERKRPAILRLHGYINQHHLYTTHAAWSLGFRDFFMSLIQELARTFLVLVTSPVVWIHAIFSLAKTFPRMWRRRKELERLGLPHRRVLV
jgi:GT2 family glycosyltransferase